jgi:hypothetical protein
LFPIHYKEDALIYVLQLRFHDHLSRAQRDEALMRRAQWQYPQGIKQLGEYWLAGNDPAVLSIFETDNFEPIFELSLTWNDLFDIQATPATEPQAGLQMGQAIMQRLQSRSS